jgi:hypothetical protein
MRSGIRDDRPAGCDKSLLKLWTFVTRPFDLSRETSAGCYMSACWGRISTPEPAIVHVGRCKYVSPCRAPKCRPLGATLVLRKLDRAGRRIRQIELCDGHAKVVIKRERARGLEVEDQRDSW